MNREPGVYCERVLQDDLAIAYLRGELGEAERDVFEQHYFECADCFERLCDLRTGEMTALIRIPNLRKALRPRLPDRLEHKTDF